MQRLSTFIKKYGIIANQQNPYENILIVSAFFLFPLFFLFSRHITNGFLAFFAVLALWHYVRYPSQLKNNHFDRASKLIIFAFSALFLGLLLAQLIRWDFHASYLDYGSRILLGALVFIYLRNKKVDAGKILIYSLPLLILIAFGVVIFDFIMGIPNIALGNVFDFNHIKFGDASLVLAFMTLLTIDAYSKDTLFIRGFKYLCYFLGLFLVLASLSRGSWTAFPFLLLLWCFIMWKKQAKVQMVSFLFLHIAIIILAYLFVPAIHDRIQQTIQNFSAYHTDPDTSIGLRFTIWHIAAILFVQSPLYGYADIAPFVNQSDIASFASQTARDLIVNAGPHNDIIRAALTGGALGLIGILSIYLIPLFVFAKRIFSPTPRIRLASQLGLFFVLGILICSGSEGMIFYTMRVTSFYTLLVAALAATALWKD
jgi:O-antigen ligase